jgi:DNA-binding transcriptional ArsR family regulator
VSAGEGIRFAYVMNEFSARVKRLGALVSSEGLATAELKSRLAAAVELVPYIKLVERQTLRVPVRTEQGYHDFFGSDEFDRRFNELVLDKLVMSRIMRLLRAKPVSAREIGEDLALDASEVVRHLDELSQQGLVRFDRDETLVAAA